MNTNLKLYYVTGKDFCGNLRTVKTEATNPANARWNAEFVLETAGIVRRA